MCETEAFPKNDVCWDLSSQKVLGRHQQFFFFNLSFMIYVGMVDRSAVQQTLEPNAPSFFVYLCDLVASAISSAFRGRGMK